MVKQIKYLEQKAFFFNAKIVVIVETLKNQIKRKTQMTSLFKEKKYNNGFMILFLFKIDLLRIYNYVSLYLMKSVRIYI